MIRVVSVFPHHLTLIALSILTVTQSPQVFADTTLKVSGTPATTAIVGAAYSFTPSVNFPAGQVHYYILNKPSWATFDVSNGHLGGIPTAPDTYINIYIEAVSGQQYSILPGFSISVRKENLNTTPTISGTPATSVTEGEVYSFTPVASDANKDKLTFSVQQCPSWASFNTATGTLSGKPTAANVGAYTNIVISARNGSSSASLKPFSIAVDQVSNGSAEISWAPPRENTNGSALTNLSGYRIYYGTTQTNLSTSVQIANPGIASYVITNLSSGTWYFDVVAYNSAGKQSSASAIGSKTIK